MTAALAMHQIEAAALSDKQYRAARRLLDHAAQRRGQLKLSKEDALAVCTTQTNGAMRRLLGQLKKAEIINYRVNGYVYVNFCAWGADDAARAESDHPRAESDHPRALSDHPRALSDHIEPSTYTHARAGVGWLVGITTTSLEDDNQPTNPPQTTSNAPADPVAQAMAFGLLKSSGIMPLNAKRLAEQHDLPSIRRAVGHWWDNRNGDFRSPGIVVSWLDKPDAAGLPDCSDAFMRSPLYRQWRTKSEIEEEQAETAANALRQAAAPPPREPPGPLEQLWREITALASCEGWLEGTRLVELSEARALIVAPRRNAEYIRSRLAKQIHRSLAIAGHRPEQIEIQEMDDGRK